MRILYGQFHFVSAPPPIEVLGNLRGGGCLLKTVSKGAIMSAHLILNILRRGKCVGTLIFLSWELKCKVPQ